MAGKIHEKKSAMENATIPNTEPTMVAKMLSMESTGASLSGIHHTAFRDVWQTLFFKNGRKVF